MKNKKCKCGNKAVALINCEYVCSKCYDKLKIRKNPFNKTSWLDKYVNGN